MILSGRSRPGSYLPSPISKGSSTPSPSPLLSLLLSLPSPLSPPPSHHQSGQIEGSFIRKKPFLCSCTAGRASVNRSEAGHFPSFSSSLSLFLFHFLLPFLRRRTSLIPILPARTPHRRSRGGGKWARVVDHFAPSSPSFLPLLFRPSTSPSHPHYLLEPSECLSYPRNFYLSFLSIPFHPSLRLFRLWTHFGVKDRSRRPESLSGRPDLTSTPSESSR